MSAMARRDRSDIRELLLEAALEEFSIHGYEGASTMAIAKRADAHQPQINYHFSGKAELWRASITYLYAQLDELLIENDRIGDVVERFVHRLRLYVRFASQRPQLNQMMIKESAVDSERLQWLVDTHVRPRQAALASAWEELVALGVAAPIDPRLAHHVLIGAVTVPFVAAAELQLLTGADPASEEMVELHTDGLVAMLLPGYVASTDAADQ